MEGLDVMSKDIDEIIESIKEFNRKQINACKSRIEVWDCNIREEKDWIDDACYNINLGAFKLGKRVKYD